MEENTNADGGRLSWGLPLALSWADIWIKIQTAREGWNPLTMAMRCSRGCRRTERSAYPSEECSQVRRSQRHLCLHHTSQGFLAETVFRPLGTPCGQHEAWDPWTWAVLLNLWWGGSPGWGKRMAGVMLHCWASDDLGITTVIPYLCFDPHAGERDLCFLLFYMNIFRGHKSRENSLVNHPDFKLSKFSIFTASTHFFSLST